MLIPTLPRGQDNYTLTFLLQTEKVTADASDFDFVYIQLTTFPASQSAATYPSSQLISSDLLPLPLSQQISADLSSLLANHRSSATYFICHM